MTTPPAIRSAPRSHGLAALVDADGSAATGYAQVLARPGTSPRDLSDAVHTLCAVHGRHPGVIDHALARAGAAQDWLASGSGGFARERGYLAQLTAAAGPTPSTPGQAEAEAAVAGVRHAFGMIAQSDREGCSLGAAAALLLDWRAVRRVLDAAAHRFGVAPPTPALPETATILAALPTGPAAERAIAFAAQQVLAQHRGLWHLLESRASARGDD